MDLEKMLKYFFQTSYLPMAVPALKAGGRRRGGSLC